MLFVKKQPRKSNVTCSGELHSVGFSRCSFRLQK